MLATDLEVGAAQPLRGGGRQRRLADAAGEEALRDRQGAAGDRRPHRGRQERREGRGRPVRLAHADAAARGFSDAAGSRRARRARRCRASALERDGRQDAIRDHRRGHAVFPQRRACSCCEPDAMTWWPPTVIAWRWSTSTRRHGSASRREEVGVILPKKTLLELGKLLSEGDGDITLRARREPPVFRGRRARADLADDRRPVPRLRAGDSEGQRQGHRVRARAADERRQARGAAVERAFARGEVRDRQGQGRSHVEQLRNSARRESSCAVDYQRQRDDDLVQRAVRPATSSTSSRPTSSRSRSRTKSARP